RRRTTRPAYAGRDGRRSARDVPRDAAALPLDGHHADAAARAAPPAAGRRDARDGVPRPGHHGRCRMVPGTPRPLSLRAGRDVRAAAAEGGPEAPVRLHGDARCRVGRAPRGRVVHEGAPRRRGGGRGPSPGPGDVDPLAGVVPDGAPVVLYVGRIAAEKGVEHLLEAARRLPDVHVVLAGPDDRHGTLALVEAAQADPRTGGRLHLLPPTPGPPYDLYRRADVFVLASGGENFGLVAAEAASVGTAVIVSDRCGVAASFEPGEAVVVPYDVDATVDAIARVLGDAALRRQLEEGALRA